MRPRSHVKKVSSWSISIGPSSAIAEIFSANTSILWMCALISTLRAIGSKPDVEEKEKPFHPFESQLTFAALRRSLGLFSCYVLSTSPLRSENTSRRKPPGNYIAKYKARYKQIVFHCPQPHSVSVFKEGSKWLQPSWTFSLAWDNRVVPTGKMIET